MALISCPECNKEISSTVKKCPHCGYKIQKGISSKGSGAVRKVALIAVIVLLIAACGGGITYFVLNHDPVAKYQRLISNGEKEKANRLYNEKIKPDKDLSSQLTKKQNSEMDSIYHDYLNEKTNYEDSTKQISIYQQYETSKEYAIDILAKVNLLKESKDAFASATDYDSAGDYVNAIQQYGLVKEEDINYATATEKVTALTAAYREQLIKEAAGYAKDKKYDKAISTISNAINVVGSDEELKKLNTTYTKAKNEMYVKVTVTNKTVTPKDVSNWIFSNYINFVFEIKNNTNKSIKGVQGNLTINDQFGEEILTMGCDFSGITIKAGKKTKVTDMTYKCNEFMAEDMKAFNTKYKDLKFAYKVTKIVYSDGSSVKPD